MSMIRVLSLNLQHGPPGAGAGDGSAATGVCHWKASKRPVTGDTGRQRSET